MMKIDNNNTFSTYDLALAAALVAQGYSIEALERTDGSSRAAFIFNRKDNLDDLIQSYWASNLVVEPKYYFDAIKHLKTMLYAETR